MKDAIKTLERDSIKELSRHLRGIRDYKRANEVFEHVSGIVDFLDTQKSYDLLLQCLRPQRMIRETGTRREYGDFQTPNELTDRVCSFLVKNRIIPQVVIEPTFGKGSFILSALRTFRSLEVLFGIELFEPYCWITKFSILNEFLKNPSPNKPKINLVQANVFTFDFSHIKKEVEGKKVLILGNPPWVTNAELSSLGSKNVPLKRNIKGHRGFSAITGKSNFDISEYIILMLLDTFARFNGTMALLVKNAVVRNVVHDLRRTQYPLGEIEAFDMDAKKYFGAAVDASLFTCRLGARKRALTCTTYKTFDRSDKGRTFGWIGDKFAADVETYVKQSDLDGVCPYVWRQGVKHDCSGVLELNSQNGRLVNKSGDRLDIETDLVYGLLKSSDLATPVIQTPRKYVIITQRRIGEDTSYIADRFPKLYAYLAENEPQFLRRKSSIYKNKPAFSIFGIGEYAFKPYKVAISGLYKRSTFSLVLPVQRKPTMLDDTCYFLGFDDVREAICVWAVLNSEIVQELLSSLIFLDAKRPFTKEYLMRIRVDEAARRLPYSYIVELVSTLHKDMLSHLRRAYWDQFLDHFISQTAQQTQLQLFREAI